MILTCLIHFYLISAPAPQIFAKTIEIQASPRHATIHLLHKDGHEEPLGKGSAKIRVKRNETKIIRVKATNYKTEEAYIKSDSQSSYTIELTDWIIPVSVYPKNATIYVNDIPTRTNSYNIEVPRGKRVKVDARLSGYQTEILQHELHNTPDNQPPIDCNITLSTWKFNILPHFNAALYQDESKLLNNEIVIKRGETVELIMRKDGFAQVTKLIPNLSDSQLPNPLPMKFFFDEAIIKLYEIPANTLITTDPPERYNSRTQSITIKRGEIINVDFSKSNSITKKRQYTFTDEIAPQITDTIGELKPTFKISTTPKDAIIHINGNYKSIGYYEVKNDNDINTGGVVEIRVTKENFRDKKLTVSTFSDVLIELDTALVTISTDPPGARITIDGTYLGLSPKKDAEIKLNRNNNIHISMNGYVSHNSTLSFNLNTVEHSKTYLLEKIEHVSIDPCQDLYPSLNTGTILIEDSDEATENYKRLREFLSTIGLKITKQHTNTTTTSFRETINDTVYSTKVNIIMSQPSDYDVQFDYKIITEYQDGNQIKTVDCVTERFRELSSNIQAILGAQ